MNGSRPLWQALPLRLTLALVLTAGFAAWLLMDGCARLLVGQEGEPKSGRVEEEDEVKPVRKPRVEEEDEPKPKRKVAHADEPKEKEPAVRPAPVAIDLRVAARNARHKEVADLFRALGEPHDVVKVRGLSIKIGGSERPGGVFHVAPLPVFAPNVGDLTGKVTLRILDKKTGSRLRTRIEPARSIEALAYYEWIARDKVNEFLELKLDPKQLPRAEQLQAAEQALSAVLRFHASARETGVRKGEGWAGVGTELRGQLLGVLLEQLEQLGKAEEWGPAFGLARRLVETYPEAGERDRIRRGLEGLTKQALTDVADVADSDGELQEAKAKALGKRLEELRLLDGDFAGQVVVRPVGEGLRKQAKALVQRAEKLAPMKGEPASRRKAREQRAELARAAWPHVPGATTAGAPQGMLRVGVRHLPIYMSPARAWTDSELRAVELVFEPLVRGGLAHRPALSEGRPKVVPLGREFRLPPNARWSDGEPVTAGDVKFTVEQLKADRTTARPIAWGHVLEDAVIGGDSTRVRVMLRQGYVDPLALMTFKIVPEHVGALQVASEAFAKNPSVGSGPYVYKEGDFTDDRNRKPYRKFEASETYGGRVGKEELPRIGEIRLIGLADATGKWEPGPALLAGKLDVALGLSAAEAAGLKGKPGIEVVVPKATRPNRRIYFLAVNHEKVELKSPHLRLALSKAIDREKLLDDHFRSKLLGQTVHKALNGPYPAGSWACNPKLKGRVEGSLDPFDAVGAGEIFKKAQEGLRAKEIALDLLYPKGDPELDKAMKELCTEVGKVLPGLTLRPKPEEAGKVREAVERRDYELAYFHHDYQDESFWLMPILGPSGERFTTRNYLDYSGPLVALAENMANRRDFVKVRDRAWALHQAFLMSEMPFVPLWQLDPLMAHRSRVKAPPLGPEGVFANVERWRLGP